MRIEGMHYKIRFIEGSKKVARADDNVDVEVEFENGALYTATFFTVSNIQSLLERYVQTGECHQGLYIWASNMIIIKEITRQNVALAVSNLIETGEFEQAFLRI